MNELTKRILVSVIGIPIGVIVMYFGGLFFNAIIGIISSLALWEFYKLAKEKKYPIRLFIGILFGLCPIIIYSFFDIYNVKYLLFQPYFLLLIIMIIMIPIFFLREKENFLAGVGTIITGFFYISLPFFLLILLRDLEKGFYYTILTFMSIWICDSTAYFIGRKLGKHKLMPSVSPKKSIEGAIAGFVASSFFFALTTNYLIPEMSLKLSIFIGIIIGIFGQIGDLIESKFKRDAGIKDSSNLIPGHGGILDRFDSIIFVVPIIYIILIFTNL